MKCKIVKSSVMDSKCWSALIMLDECHKCEKVVSCSRNRDIKEAKKGHVKILREKIKSLDKNYKEARRDYVHKQSEALRDLNEAFPDHERI